MAKRGRQGDGGGRKWFNGRNEQEVINKLEHVWALGGSDAEAAFYADIAKATLCEYLKKHPKVAERKEALKEKPILLARQAVVESFDGTKKMMLYTKDGRAIEVIAPKDSDMAMKYLERKRKAEFSTLQQVEVGEQGQFKDLTDEQLAQIAAGKATPADFMK